MCLIRQICMRGRQPTDIVSTGALIKMENEEIKESETNTDEEETTEEKIEEVV